MSKVIYEGNSILIRSDGGKELVKKPLTDYGRASLANEWTITHNLDIPGVRKALREESGEEGERLVLEYLDGETLKQWSESREFNLAEMLETAIRTAKIIGDIHDAGIIHKRITPFNILIERGTNEVVFIDFAMASKVEAENQILPTAETKAETLSYIAPEQTGRINRQIDFRSDLYSFGVTLYELFAGQRPFSSEDPLELIHAHIARTPVAPDKVNPALPSMVTRIISALLDKNPEDRYQSAQGVEVDLKRCLNEFQDKGDITEFQIRMKDVSKRFEIPQKLYGREKESKALSEIFDRVSGGDKELLLVSGYSGIGKTSLINSFDQPVKAMAGYFIKGKFNQFHRNIPYSALVQAFSGLFQSILTESDENLRLWKDRLQEALGDNGQLVINVLPEMELIIGPQPAVVELGPVESQNRFNLIFKNLIRIFSQEQPLIIFLDDLQWIDNASLKLLHLIISDQASSHLLLLGAYRDNEVDATHPLMRMLNELRRESVRITEIILGPLSEEHVRALIGDTCNVDRKSTTHLARLIMDKTAGNPFFVNQFLKALQADNLLCFDLRRREWTWNIASIKDRNISNNVLDLMVSRLCKLTETTQQVLKLASCIGSVFDTATICTVCEEQPEELTEKLAPAIKVGLIQSVETPASLPSGQTYRFLHDRVQQAAYSLIEDEKKKETHLEMGRMLFQNIDKSSLHKKIFLITDHYNIAIELLEDKREKIEIATLNLSAGDRAISTMANEAATEYFQAGLSLLPENCWEENYSLTFDLTCGLIKSSYLTASYIKAEELCNIAIHKARGSLDKSSVYTMMCYNLTLQNKMEETLRTGLDALKILNIPLLENPPENLDIDELRDLAEMTDPNKLAAMSILVKIISCALVTQSPLMMPLIYTMVDLSAKHGNSSRAPFGYVWYGCSLCWNGKDMKIGYNFGRLAIDILGKFQSREVETTVLHQFNSFIRHWCEHENHSLNEFPHVVEVGKETGDVEYGTYVAVNYVANLLLCGEPLAIVQEKQRPYLDWVASTRFSFSLTYGSIFAQAAQCLMGQGTGGGELIKGDFMDEEKLIPEMLKTKNNLNLFALFAAKAMLSYFNGRFHESALFACEAEQYELAIGSLLPVTQVPFYGALAILKISRPGSGIDPEHAKRLENYEGKLGRWAEHGGMNFQHKLDLVLAEKARVQSNPWLAVKLYEQAIKGAKGNQYMHEYALASELAASFYRDEGLDEMTGSAINNAYRLYDTWGALPKLKQLRQGYSKWLTEESVEPKQLQSLGKSLDMHSIIKSMSALSENIVLSNLLTRMMDIVIENAGAQRGAIILKNKNEWFVEGVSDIETGQTDVLMSVPLVKGDLLPQKVVNYIIHTGQKLHLANACQVGQFINDSFIRQHQTKSILCLPLINHGDFNGVLYLENNLIENAFTPDQQEILEILLSQISISLENATLYSGITNSLKEKEVLLHEIHHRVKNNLQIISSLMMLQSRQIDDEKYQAIFRGSENRIKSMSLVHEKLYQTKDLGNIDFGDYTKSLAHQIFHSLGANPQMINMNIEADEIFLPVDKAIPCGLIINELITNSLKHAFPGDRKGELSIKMLKVARNGGLTEDLKPSIQLVVSDNGIGFPEDSDFLNTSSLGLTIVTNLVRQIRGEVKMSGDKGTEYKIEFLA